MDKFIKILIDKESEILEQLKPYQHLINQLDALRATIKTFQETENKQAAIIAHSAAIEKDDDSAGVNIEAVGIPAEYSAKLSWRNKTLFVLSQIKEGFKDEVANEWAKHEPSIEYKWLLRKAATTLSELKGKEVLSSRTIGVKEKYFIK